MTIHYRNATLNDKAALDDCLQQIVSTERPMDECLKPGHIEYYNPLDFITDNQKCLIVAEREQKIVACGAAKIQAARDYYHYEQQLLLNMMYVHPDFRGQGINGEIIQRLLTWGKTNGVHNAALTVYPNNPSAIQAYTKLGFEPALIEMRLRHKSDD